MPIELAEITEASSHYKQNIFRLSQVGEANWLLRLTLQLPTRQAGDKKPISAKQRETLAAFFWDTDLLPPIFGWQQAGRLMDMRELAYAVSETMEEGFLAANRMEIAPIIAAYISRSPYLVAVARGWNLGTWRDSSSGEQSNWLMLVASPFYKELLEFALLARHEFEDAMNSTS